jgi:ribosomal protein L11 methyltransferase
MTDVVQEGEWLELATTVEPEAVDAVAAVFGEYGKGVSIEHSVESSRDGDVVSLPQDAPVIIKTYLPLAHPELKQRQTILEVAIWALGKLRNVGPLSTRTLREEDWANAWKEYFFVHRVGKHTVIVPSWRESDYVRRPGDLVLLLDPGMAFGTGLHPTTRLCLRAVEEFVQPGARVLDVGAGSGILSIASARKGAASVEAVEIDPVAASVCAQNVERNRVGDIVGVRTGSLEERTDQPVDLILANITIATLLELHQNLAEHLRPGGLAVLSGVLAERADELRDALTGAGWQHVRTDQEQDWVALIVQR